ncbi:MAG: hypothetical protein GXO87_13395 [Chlorobi bacterium]|nr:hypothetical protein [Chlorobiota bacterium]
MNLFFFIGLILFFSAFSSNNLAQTNSPKFEYVPFDKGISPKVVLCIIQDSKGFMWFGTLNGLYKYDGYNFTVYKNEPDNPHSLSDDNISSLFEDKAGNLWIGTGDGGLNRFNQRKNQFIHYLPDSADTFSISDNRIMVICEDQTGALWIGTQRGGLNKLLPSSNLENETGVSAKFIHYKHNPNEPNSLSNNDVRNLLVDRSGNLWIGTEHGGLNILNLKTEKFTRYREGADDGSHLINDTITSLYQDQSGIIWIGTYKGINRFNPKTGYISRFGFAPADRNSLNDACVWSITEDLSGNFWFGAEVGFGLYKYEPKSNRTIRFQNDSGLPYILRYGAITSVYKDRTGLLWFGAWNGGIYKYNPLTEQFGHVLINSKVPQGSLETWVNTMLEDHSGNLWIGTETGEMKKLLPNFQRGGERIFKTYKKNNQKTVGLYNNSISVIREDKNGKFWIGTNKNGLSIFDPKTGRFDYFNPDPKVFYVQVIQSLYIDRSGVIWIGTLSGGIYLYDPSSKKFRNYRNIPGNQNSLISNRVYTFYEDSKGWFWIGTAGGLDRFILSKGKGVEREILNLKHYLPDPNDSTSLSNNDVISILEDKSGVIWVGTQGGLNKLQSVGGRGFTHYTEKDGLPDNVIDGILEDDQGNLWIGTNNGLSKFNPKTEIFKNYYIADGLQDNKFKRGAFVKRKNGMLCFGGMNGFNMFNPDSIKENTHAPKIAITDFQFLNQSIKAEENPLLTYSIAEDNAINLTYKDYLLSFEFSALDFTNPAKNQYAYMMVGLENNWNYIGGRHFVTFTTLPPGDYTFKVKGANSDGIWNRQGASIKILVAPPPWKTWWAYSLYVFTLIGFVLGYIRFRTKAQAKELAFKEKELILSKQNEIAHKKAYSAIEKEKTTRQKFTQRLLTAYEEERKRISFELHDAVGQDLLVIKNMTDLIKKNISNVETTQEYLDDISEAAVSSIRDVRHISRNLHPYQLEKLGLTSSLVSLISRVGSTTEIKFETDIENIDGKFIREKEIHIYRILQELLNNIIKHSKADKVKITVNQKDDQISITVGDNGCGFETDRQGMPSNVGIGLTGILERLSLLNGGVKINSTVGIGTTVSILIKTK